MKGETTRRGFLKGLSGVVALPSIAKILDRAVSRLNTPLGNSTPNSQQESDERLE